MANLTTHTLTVGTRRKLVAQIAVKDKGFIRFLKERRILHTFFNNIRKSTSYDQGKYLSTLKDLRREYINWGLVWSTTPEGHTFWEKYNNQWKDDNRLITTDGEYLKQVENALFQILKNENKNERIHN